MARSTKFNITVTESTDEELKYEFGCGKFMDFFVEPLVQDLIENHLDELIIKKRLKTRPPKDCSKSNNFTLIE